MKSRPGWARIVTPPASLTSSIASHVRPGRDPFPRFRQHVIHRQADAEDLQSLHYLVRAAESIGPEVPEERQHAGIGKIEPVRENMNRLAGCVRRQLRPDQELEVQAAGFGGRLLDAIRRVVVGERQTSQAARGYFAHHLGRGEDPV